MAQITASIRENCTSWIVSRRIMLVISTALIFFTSICSNFTIAAEPEPQEKKLPATEQSAADIAKAYQRHRDSIPFVTCKFRVVSGFATSLANARSGHWVDGKTITRDGEWIAHGKRIKSVLNCTRPPVLLGVAGNKATFSCNSEQYLSDGRYRLNYSPDVAAATIRDNDKEPNNNWGPDFSPMSMGVMGPHEFLNPHDMIHRSLEGGFCLIEEDEEVMGHRTRVVAIGIGDQLVQRCFFDPARGYLPIRIDSYRTGDDHELLGITTMTEIKQCSSGRWFPMRSLRVSLPNAPDGKERHVWTIETLSVDIDTPPEDKDFALDLAGDIVVTAFPSSNPGGSRLKKKTHIDLSNLTALYDELSAPVATVP